MISASLTLSLVMQDATKAARERAAGAADQQFLEEAAGGGEEQEAAQPDEAARLTASEAQYHAELRAELQVIKSASTSTCTSISSGLSEVKVACEAGDRPAHCL